MKRDRRADALRSLRKSVLLLFLSFLLSSVIFGVIRMTPPDLLFLDTWNWSVMWKLIFLDTPWIGCEVWIVWFICSSFTSSRNVSQPSRQINGLKSSGVWTLNRELISLLNDAHRQTRRHGGETSYFGGSQYDIHSSDCLESEGKGIFLTSLDLFASFELL